MTQAIRICLNNKPQQTFTEKDFDCLTVNVPDPGAGEVLVKPLYFSLDPYLAGMMRAWQGPHPLWSEGVVVGRMVGEVVASNDPRFAPGDRVKGESPWQSLAVIGAGELEAADEVADSPISVHLSVLGSSGLTAWIGIHKILRIQPGETLSISSAAGTVGGLAGQLARLAGARVIGIAGGEEKCRQVVEELGFDACVDHWSKDLEAALASAADGTLDAHYENVGAKTLDPALALLGDGGRIALCGLIAHYQDNNPIALKHFRRLLTGALTLTGFRLFDHTEDYATALAALRQHVIDGNLSVRETLSDGLEKAPRAFIDMLEGRGAGKHLIRV
ncbi:MAG: NADP-dependent oxidoreductase [Porticoccaceae bacterium]|nr:NADP-dependent oxidoreductase [Porticoccaceae bacterium]